MEGPAEFHRVDHDGLVGELEPDDLQQVAGAVGADGQHSGWVAVGLEVDDHDRVFERVDGRGVIDAVFVG